MGMDVDKQVVSPSIAESVRRYLAVVEETGVPVVGAVVYGSFARGEQTVNSDIDLLVLSPLFDRAKENGTVDRLWHIAWRVDSRIEPVAVGVREFEENEDSPLIAMARREGVMIYADQPDAKPARVAEDKARYGTGSRRRARSAGRTIRRA
jgi:predicted nucleotidyltransferase